MCEFHQQKDPLSKKRSTKSEETGRMELKLVHAGSKGNGHEWGRRMVVKIGHVTETNSVRSAMY